MKSKLIFLIASFILYWHLVFIDQNSCLVN